MGDTLLNIVNIIYYLSYGIAAWVVYKWRVKGVLCGALVVWLLPWFSQMLLAGHDSSYASFGMGVQFFAGWLFALLYCVFVYCLLVMIDRFQKKPANQK
jgi:hypothetical protein